MDGGGCCWSSWAPTSPCPDVAFLVGSGVTPKAHPRRSRPRATRSPRKGGRGASLSLCHGLSRSAGRTTPHPFPPVAGFLPTPTSPRGSQSDRKRGGIPTAGGTGPAPASLAHGPPQTLCFHRCRRPRPLLPAQAHTTRPNPSSVTRSLFHLAPGLPCQTAATGRGRGRTAGRLPLVCLSVSGATRPPWDLGAGGAGAGGTYSEPASTLGPRT